MGIKDILLACICIFPAGILVFLAKDDSSRLTVSISQESTRQGTSELLAAPLVTQSNYKQINTLFGRIIETSEKAEPQQVLPETRLNLTLKGTFTHIDSSKASALIAENSNNTERFFVGDEIPGGAELVAVRKGEITLRRNGQDELLKLPYLKTDERITQNSRRRMPSSKQTSPVSRSSQTETNSNSNKSLTNVTNNSHQQQLKDRLAKLRNNRSRSTSSQH